MGGGQSPKEKQLGYIYSIANLDWTCYNRSEEIALHYYQSFSRWMVQHTTDMHTMHSYNACYRHAYNACYRLYHKKGMLHRISTSTSNRQDSPLGSYDSSAIMIISAVTLSIWRQLIQFGLASLTIEKKNEREKIKSGSGPRNNLIHSQHHSLIT